MPGLPVINRRIVYSSRSDEFCVVPLADLHCGNSDHRPKCLRKWLARIVEDPKCYAAGLGDWCDWINRKDSRYKEEALAPWLFGISDIAKAEREYVIEETKPLRGKLLALVEGNHEEKILAKQERDVYSTLGEALRADDEPLLLGPAGFLRLSFEREGGGVFCVTFYLTHGWWGGRLAGSGALNLERLAGMVDADVILAAHDHRKRVFPNERISATRHRAYLRTTYAASCGNFMPWPLYAREKGYKPLSLGPLEVIIRPGHKEISVRVPDEGSVRI